MILCRQLHMNLLQYILVIGIHSMARFVMLENHSKTFLSKHFLFFIIIFIFFLTIFFLWCALHNAKRCFANLFNCGASSRTIWRYSHVCSANRLHWRTFSNVSTNNSQLSHNFLPQRDTQLCPTDNSLTKSSLYTFFFFFFLGWIRPCKFQHIDLLLTKTWNKIVQIVCQSTLKQIFAYSTMYRCNHEVNSAWWSIHRRHCSRSNSSTARHWFPTCQTTPMQRIELTQTILQCFWNTISSSNEQTTSEKLIKLVLQNQNKNKYFSLGNQTCIRQCI